MKAMFKSELARMSGVSYKTFQRWLNNHREELKSMGITERAHVVHPDAAKWICKQYGIDLVS